MSSRNAPPMAPSLVTDSVMHSAGARSAPRERILAAMTELVGEQGYAATTVAHVIARAGASRRTFYELYRDKLACMLEAAEGAVERWTRHVCGAPEQNGDLVEAFVDRLAQMAIAEPAALRLLVAEMPAAGEAALELRERLFADLGSALARAIGQQRLGGSTADGSRGSPASVLSAAMARVLYAQVLAGGRIRRRRRGVLAQLVPGLSRWARLYQSTSRLARAADHEPPPVGGRAPGSLSLSSSADARRGLSRSESAVSRSFVVHHQRERLLDAIARLCARKGFGAVSIPDIVEDAAVSVQAFYEHFASREDVLLVAFEIGHRKMLALLESARADRPEPLAAAEAGIDTLLRFYASEPAFARLALVDVPAAGAKLAPFGARTAEAIAALLARGNGGGRAKGAGALATEASAYALYELCSRHAAGGRAAKLTGAIGVAQQLALTPLHPA